MLQISNKWALISILLTLFFPAEPIFLIGALVLGFYWIILVLRMETLVAPTLTRLVLYTVIWMLVSWSILNLTTIILNFKIFDYFALYEFNS
jgi:hypothetical protein